MGWGLKCGTLEVGMSSCLKILDTFLTWHSQSWLNCLELKRGKVFFTLIFYANYFILWTVVFFVDLDGEFQVYSKHIYQHAENSINSNICCLNDGHFETLFLSFSLFLSIRYILVYPCHFSNERPYGAFPSFFLEKDKGHVQIY